MGQMNLPTAVSLEANDPVSVLRGRLSDCGVDGTMRLIYEAYGGNSGEPVASVAPQRIAQLAADVQAALRADLVHGIQFTRPELERLLDKLEQTFKVRDIRSYVPPAGEWGKPRPQVDRARKELPTFLGYIAHWRKLIAGAEPPHDIGFAGLDLQCARLRRMWWGAQALMPAVPAQFAAQVDLSEVPAVIALWTEAAAVKDAVARLLRRKHAQLTGASGFAAWQELRVAVAGRPLPLTRGVIAVFLSSVSGKAETGYDGFLGIVTEIATVLGLACERDGAWAKMLDACIQFGDAAWWRPAFPRVDDPAGEGMGEVAMACAAAERLIASEGLSARLASHLPDEAMRARLIYNGALIRLGAVALVAPRATRSHLSAWLKTSSAGRSELDRALDKQTAPRRWKVLMQATRIYELTQQAHPMLTGLRTKGPIRMRHMTGFSLASKAYAFTSKGKLTVPAEIHNEEPKFLVTKGWGEYVTDMKVRCVHLGKTLQLEGDLLQEWHKLWTADAFKPGDHPVAAINVSISAPAANPGERGYMGGYAFLKHVLRQAMSLPQDARALVIPVLTVPIRTQWWDKPKWLADAPSKTELLWFMRWLAVIDPWFKGSVFAPLCPADDDGSKEDRQ